MAILGINETVPGQIPFGLNVSIKRLTTVELEGFIKDVSSEYLRFAPYINKELNYQGDFSPENIPSYIPEASLIAFFHFLPVRFIEKYNKKLQEVRIEYLDWAEAKTTQFFTSKIRYLGPSRTDPQASQKFAPSSEIDDVGAKGEHSAVVYHANQNAIIQWYNPSTQATEESALNIAFNAWVRYLGIAHEIKTQEIGLGLVSWRVIHMEGQKDSDQAKAWRLMLQQHGAGWRLHYWKIPTHEGYVIEFANVCRESEREIC